MTNIQDKLALARLMARKKFPYFSVAIHRALVRMAPGLGTFAMTDKGILLIDPERVSEWEPEQIATVYVHEIRHWLLKHFMRSKAIEATPQTWNLASDAEINDDLLDAKCTFPGDPVTPATIGCDPHLTAEEYYRHLIQQQQGKEKGNGRKEKNIENGNRDEYNDDFDDKDKDPSSNTSNSNATNNNGSNEDQTNNGSSISRSASISVSKTPEGTRNCRDASEADSGVCTANGNENGKGTKTVYPEICHGGCGSVSGHAHPKEKEYVKDEERGVTTPELERIVRITAEAVRKEAQKGRGNIPGDLLRWADSILEAPKVPWRQKLAHLVRQAIAFRPGAVDLTYSRVSRRQGGVGYGIGHPIITAYHWPTPNVAVVVDTSGSMGANELSRALAESKGVLAAVGAQVDFCACDASVGALKKVRHWRELLTLLVGGGGTDFRPAFEEMEKRRPKPEVVIYITDGMGIAPQEPPPFKVVWVLCGRHQQKPPCTWGEIVEIEEEIETKKVVA